MPNSSAIELDESTIAYLVFTFGFGGSPGEWAPWGLATEMLHSQFRPADGRRDTPNRFSGDILVDDAVLIEPVIGLRPRVSATCYEAGLLLLLGPGACNKEKN